MRAPCLSEGAEAWRWPWRWRDQENRDWLRCDLCDEGGVAFLDGYWVCEACRKAYLLRLQVGG